MSGWALAAGALEYRRLTPSRSREVISFPFLSSTGQHSGASNTFNCPPSCPLAPALRGEG